MTWINDRGGNGNATIVGDAWTANGVVLQVGQNILTVTASDAAGNSSQVQTIIDRLSPAHNTLEFVTSPIPDELRIRFFGRPRQAYEIQSSSDLVFWNPISTNTVSVLGYLDFTRVISNNVPAMFFRVRAIS